VGADGSGGLLQLGQARHSVLHGTTYLPGFMVMEICAVQFPKRLCFTEISWRCSRQNHSAAAKSFLSLCRTSNSGLPGAVSIGSSTSQSRMRSPWRQELPWICFMRQPCVSGKFRLFRRNYLGQELHRKVNDGWKQPTQPFLESFVVGNSRTNTSNAERCLR